MSLYQLSSVAALLLYGIKPAVINWSVVINGINPSVISCFIVFTDTKPMNDLPLIGFLFYVQRILGSPGGKHCKLLEGNVWRKVVLMPKKMIFEGVRGFFAAILSEMDLDHVDTWEV